MLKIKKHKKSKEKKLKDLPKKIFGEQNKDLGDNELKKQIRETSEGLYFMSETDAEILPFFGKQAQAVTKEEILSQTKSVMDAPVEERNFTEFFARLTEIQDWFGDEEKATAQKFAELKNLLESNLRDLKVFKIGKIQLDIYAVGLDAENNLLGIKTKAVET
jgi:hypothetical protein